MGLLNKLFGKSKSNKNIIDDKPPIYGGNGTSKENAAIINCASMPLANRLMNNFISEKHGELEADWNRTIEYFLNSEDEKNSKIRVVGIECSDSSEHQYYFNVSRPMNVANKMLGLD